jgi:Na+-translocating ferredoxin:NAD+ oxidoreductase RnfE subunit
MLLAALPPGAFILAGLLIALKNVLTPADSPVAEEPSPQ